VGVSREGINNPSPTISEADLEAELDRRFEPVYGRPRLPVIRKPREIMLKHLRRNVIKTAEGII
jgi:hypothetical protein